MAGLDLGGGGGRRRGVDSEINMIPMIDLLMVTISFLLITAVWSHATRLDAGAQVPGRPDGPITEPERRLHVSMRDDDRFVLTWKAGAVALTTVEVRRPAGGAEAASYPELAATVAREWREHGQHASPTDGARDQVVLHTGDRADYRTMVAVMDAVEATVRPVAAGGTVATVPVFAVTLATD